MNIHDFTSRTLGKTFDKNLKNVSELFANRKSSVSIFRRFYNILSNILSFLAVCFSLEFPKWLRL